MMIDLVNLRMSDRFTHKIKVYPRIWTKKRLPKKFKIVLFHHDIPILEGDYPSLEEAEQSIRNFLELEPEGRGEIYDYEEN